MCVHADDDAAIIDGSNYAFTIAAPKGWKLTSTEELPAAFHPADTTFEKSAVVMYVRPGDKRRLGVSNVQEMNGLDLKGIQQQHPDAKSEKVGTVKTALGIEIPLYSFSGGGYSELVAYAEHEKTITVFVVSADTNEQLKAARPAFDAMVASYIAFSTKAEALKNSAAKKKKAQSVGR